jgi:hypothetical protein
MPLEPSRTLTSASASLNGVQGYTDALQRHVGPIAEIVGMTIEIEHHQESGANITLASLKQNLSLDLLECPLKVFGVEQSWPADPVDCHMSLLSYQVLVPFPTASQGNWEHT